MLKFWLFLFMFSINQVKNEKCCDAHSQTFSEENINKVVKPDSTKSCHKPNPNEGVIVLNITHIPIKEKQPCEEDKTAKDTHTAQTNLKTIPVSLPTKKPNDPIPKPTTIKLTKGGTIYFMKNIQDSIKKHPVLSKNAKVITEILNEAIENATIALRELADKQQREAAINAEKKSSAIKASKPDEAACNINSLNLCSDKPKQNVPVIHHVIEIPHALNESNVILCDDSGQKIKINSSVIVKHDDGDTHVHLVGKNITTKHEDLCSTGKKISDRAPERKVCKDRMKCETSQNVKPGCLTDLLKKDKLSDVRAQNKDVTKDKLISLLKPKNIITLTTAAVPTMIDSQIEHLSDNDGTDLEENSSAIVDVEDRIYEETYAKGSDVPSYSYANNVYPQEWYNNMPPYGGPSNNYPYYQSYGQYAHPSYTETVYNPGTFYANSGACTIQQYDGENNVPSCDQNSYAYRNEVSNNSLQRGHSDLLRRLWWDRKIRFYNGNIGTQCNPSVSSQYGRSIKADLNPYCYHMKRNYFQY